MRSFDRPSPVVFDNSSTARIASSKSRPDAAITLFRFAKNSLAACRDTHTRSPNEPMAESRLSQVAVLYL